MMRFLPLAVACTLSAFLFASCTDNKPEAFDFDWVDFGIVPGTAPSNTIIAFGNRIMVGTDDGVVYYQVSSTAPAWVTTNLTGVKITELFLHPLVANTIYALADPNASTNTAEETFPLYRSTNSGTTWTGIGAGLLDEVSGTYPKAYSISEKIIPDQSGFQFTTHLYLGLEGNIVARSTDNGVTWTVIQGNVANPTSQACYINVVQSFYTYLFQGCNTQGQPSIDRIDLNVDNHVTLPQGTRVIAAADIANKEVVGFKNSLYSEGLHYGLLKGGLIALIDTEWRWVYQYPPSQGEGLNTVMTFIWINPRDQNYLMFGGYGEGNSTGFHFYETPNHGRTVTMVEPPDFLGLNAPKILDAYEAGSSAQDIIMLVSGMDGSNQLRSRVVGRAMVLAD